MNDRSLRSIVVDLGGIANGYPRQDGFDISVASEIMAIFCLSKDLKDLEKELEILLLDTLEIKNRFMRKILKRKDL